MVDVALSAASSGVVQELRAFSQTLSRQAEERRRCSQKLRYTAAILGVQPLAGDLSSSCCRRRFFPSRLEWR